jgi:hypothetical protein
VIPDDGAGTAALAEFIGNGIVPVLFADTRGGTELDVRLDPCETTLAQADFARATGTARLVGRLVLDDVPVQAVVDIAVATLSGTCRLRPLGAATEPDTPS